MAKASVDSHWGNNWRLLGPRMLTCCHFTAGLSYGHTWHKDNKLQKESRELISYQDLTAKEKR